MPPTNLELLKQAARMRLRLAAAAEQMADIAESFAGSLEQAARWRDTDRRLHLAAIERSLADVGRRNAARLREVRGGQLDLQHLPSIYSP